jgi:integrase
MIYWKEKRDPTTVPPKPGRVREVIFGRGTEDEAETARQQIALALRGADWPAWAQVKERKPKRADYSDLDDTLARYRVHLAANCTPMWAATSARYVKAWLDRVAPGEATPREAQEFVDSYAAKAPTTRNHARNCCGKFMKWLALPNVFAGIRKARLVDPEDGIQYFTRGERDAILEAMAKDNRAISALWVAFYSGLRREEIARLEWTDIDFGASRITIRKSKTGRRRVIPLAARLAEFLQPRKKKLGHVVPWNHSQEGTDWKSIARNVTTNIRRALPHLSDRVGWNTFRHTFASLLVQPPARVSIDAISSWLGDSPEVCRRHYAQFIPRDGKDAAIDAL